MKSNLTYDGRAIFRGEKVLCEHCGWPKRFYNRYADRLICVNCKHWVYRNNEAKLKYKNKEQINKLKRLYIF